MPAPTWVYVKAYVHDRPETIDWLIVNVLPDLRAQIGASRWFFLRYIDEGGMHLRIRFAVPAGAADATGKLLARALTVDYTTVDRAGFTGIDWFTPRLRLARTSCAAATTVVAATYVPEYEVYGRAELGIAEELFTVSSDIALDDLAARTAGRCGASDAKLAALAYMDAVRAEFAADRDEETFWTAYRDHWLRSSQAAGKTLRDRVLRAAERGSAALRGVPLPPAARWRAALSEAAQRYGGNAGPNAVRQFVHLTNNRLGILGIEEAFLAQLLLGMGCVAR